VRTVIFIGVEATDILCRRHNQLRMEKVVEKRPWGHFERFTLNEPCTVKLIYLDGNKRLSLQYHNNRSEFWKVVKGKVRVQLGNEKKLLEAGESVLIPQKTNHRLEGAGADAIVLEIALGVFDEADIVRLDDDYARK
jgi:mannose-6-phosphate isomerase-like protein (cupin superfamily)